MRILLINGSPKGERSNSLRLAKAFLKGFESGAGESVVTDRVDVCDLDVKPCRGCFGCWKATPGQCVIHDDMAGVIEKMKSADIVVFSFPLYYFGVPGPLKNLIDRQLPMVLPTMVENTDGTGSGSHPMRWDIDGQKCVLISTCGFYSTVKNYDGVLNMFDHFRGRGKYETIFCAQGELFSVKEMHEITDRYLGAVERAGAEYARGGISAQTRSELDRLLLPKEQFEAMANASWGVDPETGEKEDRSLSFTRQMAALYNPKSWSGADRVLEICYTDLGKTYQILLGRDGSEVRSDGSLKATTRIDTPWETWLEIAGGERRGDAALAEGLYRVSGDFSLLLNWDSVFGSRETEERTAPSASGKKPPSMLLMLAAWAALWIGLGISVPVGAPAAMAVCALLPLLFFRRELCVYDRISLAAASALALFALLTGRGETAEALGFLLFGLLWLGSCLTKEPLCAAYVKYGYGGDDALNNPIFMKTNVIIAAGWGALYIVIAAVSFLLGGRLSPAANEAIRYASPALMGVFTVWFEKWYPAHVAKGKR